MNQVLSKPVSVDILKNIIIDLKYELEEETHIFINESPKPESCNSYKMSSGELVRQMTTELNGLYECSKIRQTRYEVSVTTKKLMKKGL